MIIKKLNDNNFHGADDYARVHFVWGIDELVQDNTSMWDSRDLGAPVLDRYFDPLDSDTFSLLIKFCTELQA